MLTQSAVTADDIRKKRRWKRVGGVAVLLMGALCVGSWLLWRGDDGSAGAAGKPAALSKTRPGHQGDGREPTAT